MHKNDGKKQYENQFLVLAMLFTESILIVSRKEKFQSDYKIKVNFFSVRTGDYVMLNLQFLYRFCSCIYFSFIFITWKLLWLNHNIIISGKPGLYLQNVYFHISKKVFFGDVIDPWFPGISVRHKLDKLDLFGMFS